MSAEEIAGAFMQHYYGTLDSNIAGLGPLYVSHFCASIQGDWGGTGGDDDDDRALPNYHSGTTRC